MSIEKIFRKTEETVSGDSLQRYETITNIMINEYGYKLIKTGNNHGITFWLLSKSTQTENNQDMKEEYLIENIPTWEDTKRSWEKLTPMILKGLKNKKSK